MAIRKVKDVADNTATSHETEIQKTDNLVKVEVVQTYHDIKLDEIKNVGETFQATTERAAELEKAKVARITQ